MDSLFEIFDQAIENEEVVTFVTREATYKKKVESALMTEENKIEIIAEDQMAIIDLNNVSRINEKKFLAFDVENGREMTNIC